MEMGSRLHPKTQRGIAAELQGDRGRAFNLHAVGILPTVDGRVTRHAGYRASQRIRKRIEEAFGWSKEIGAMRRTRFRGLARVGLAFGFTAAAYNLIQLPKLLAA
jgi:Transposase DDE domain